MFVKQNMSLFSSRSAVHTHNTRHRYDLDTPSTHLSKSVNSHSYQQLKFFNKLPCTVRNIQTPKLHKLLLNWFKVKAFYTIGEYLEYDTSESEFNGMY